MLYYSGSVALKKSQLTLYSLIDIVIVTYAICMYVYLYTAQICTKYTYKCVAKEWQIKMRFLTTLMASYFRNVDFQYQLRRTALEVLHSGSYTPLIIFCAYTLYSDFQILLC